jgi:Ca2+-binding EF-hand superfamily protein
VAASKEEALLQKQKLENAFAYLDTAHNGYITAEEISPFLDHSDQTE